MELDKYIAHHNLGNYGTKRAKLEAIKENIIQELAKRIATISRLLIHSVVNQKTAQRKKTASLQRLVFQALKRKRNRLKKKK